MTICLALAGALCAMPVRVMAFDPLLAIPDALDTGISLPGDTAQALTLAEAVDLALCNNPQIQSAWAGIKQQAAVLGEARAAYLPTLSASVSRISDKTRYPGTLIGSSTVHASTANATLNWRLLDAGGRSANHHAAEDLLTAALANHEIVICDMKP